MTDIIKSSSILLTKNNIKLQKINENTDDLDLLNNLLNDNEINENDINENDISLFRKCVIDKIHLDEINNLFYKLPEKFIKILLITNNNSNINIYHYNYNYNKEYIIISEYFNYLLDKNEFNLIIDICDYLINYKFNIHDQIFKYLIT